MNKFDFLKDTYEYERSRIKAFCIRDNKLYESDQHFECYLKMVEELGIDREDAFDLDDDVILKMTGAEEVINGEIANINGCEIMIINDEEDRETINKFFSSEMPCYIYDKGMLNKVA